MFAISAPGLEQIVRDELRSIGIVPGEVVSGGVAFEGHARHLALANLWSRTASRIVVRADEFHASSFHELERRAKRVQWERFVSLGQAVGFRVTCRKSRLYHSDAVADRLVQAIERQVGGNVAVAIENESGEEGTATLAGERPGESAGQDSPQLFIVRIANDICTISADSSGELLHRRGYRKAVAKAPLRETLAAAMLIGSGWDQRSSLVDPMCGSGTIAIEAALMARRIAPGINRRFAFERWPDHDENAWRAVVERARESALAGAPAPILASDRDEGGVGAARANAVRAGVEGDINIETKAVSAVEFPAPAGWIVSNPPYGLRTGDGAPLRNLYAQIGKIMRERACEYGLALLSADKSLDAQLRLDLREEFRTTNGGIPVRLIVAQAP